MFRSNIKGLVSYHIELYLKKFVTQKLIIMGNSDEDKKDLEAAAVCGLLKFAEGRKKRQLLGEKVKKSQLQQTVLKKVYEITNFPSTETRNDLSILIGIPQRSIQVWFQNRRQITRKNKDKSQNPNDYNKECDGTDERDDEELFDIPTIVLIDMIMKCRKR